MAYDYNKKSCDVCGHKPTNKGLRYDTQDIGDTLILKFNGGVVCVKCNRENELKNLITAKE